MASVSVSHAIMFIASLVVAAAIAGVLVTGVSEIGDSIDQRSTDTSEDIRTDVQIISDPGSGAIHSDDNVTLLVKNTGSTALQVDRGQVDVLVNGQFEPITEIERADGSDETAWASGDVVRIVVDDESVNVDSADNRVKVIVNSDEEVLRFRT